MTDKELDKYLKAVLTAKISEEDIKVDYSRESKDNNILHKKNWWNMKTINYRWVTGVVLAVIIVSVSVLNIPKYIDNKQEKNIVQTNTTSSFSVTAYATELNDEYYTFIDGDFGSGWSVNKWTPWSYFMFSPDIQVEGEGIDHITYQVENGLFQIIGKKDSMSLKNIKIAEEEYSKLFYQYGASLELKYGYTDELFDAKGGVSKDVDIIFATEYTVDYTEQKQKNLQINLCGKNIMPDSYLLHPDSLNETQKTFDRFNQLLENIRVKCIVYYSDGRTQIETIQMGGVIKEFTDINGETYTYAGVGFKVMK